MTVKSKDPKRLAYAICEYLSDSIADGTIQGDDGESMEVSIQCISQAFGFEFGDAATAKTLSIKPASLSSIFDVFAATQKKVASGTGNTGAASGAAATGSAKSADSKARAEALKAEGNKLVGMQKYADAVLKYSEAIDLDPLNAVYYSNRAAAYSQDGDHANAVEDSKRALEVDPSFSKAYSRLGHAYFCLGDYAEAITAYEQGLKLDPTNAAMKQSLSTAKSKHTESGGMVAGSDSGAADPLGGLGGGFPGMPGMGAGGGGMPDIGAMMNNPAFMKMAESMMGNPAISQMLKNPAVMKMAENAMKDPNALAGMMNDPNLMSNLGSLGGPAGGMGGTGSGIGGSEGGKKKNKKK